MEILAFTVLLGCLVTSSLGQVTPGPSGGAENIVAANFVLSADANVTTADQTTTLWSMVTGTQNPNQGLLGPAGPVGAGPGPDAHNTGIGQGTTTVMPPPVTGSTPPLTGAGLSTTASIGPMDLFGGLGGASGSAGGMTGMMDVWNMINTGTGLNTTAGLTTQQLASMMTNSGGYYNMTVGNITGSGYPTSYPNTGYPSGYPSSYPTGHPSGYPTGAGTPLDNTIGMGLSGTYPTVGTTVAPLPSGGSMSSAGFNDLLNGLLSSGGSSMGTLPAPGLPGLPSMPNTNAMASALALMQQRKMQQQRQQQQQQQQMTNMMTATMLLGEPVDLKDLMPIMMMMMMSGQGQQQQGMNSMLRAGRPTGVPGGMDMAGMFPSGPLGGSLGSPAGAFGGLPNSGLGATAGGGAGGADLSWLSSMMGGAGAGTPLFG